MLTGCTCRVYFPWLRAILSPAIYLWDSFTPLKGQPCFFFLSCYFYVFFMGLDVYVYAGWPYWKLSYTVLCCTSCSCAHSPRELWSHWAAPGEQVVPAWSQGSATNPRQEQSARGVSMLAGSPSCVTQGFVVWEVWLVWLRFLCPLLPRLVRAPSAPRRQDRLHLLLVILSWCTLGNLLRPLTFFVCACFLGRKSLSEVNILCEM